MYFAIKEAGENLSDKRPEQPHPNATWDDEAESWIIMINDLGQLFDLLDEYNPIMLRPGTDCELPSLEIWEDDQ